MPKERQVNRIFKKRILILCEGKKTEPLYFNGIKQTDDYKYHLATIEVKVHNSNKNTPRELVKQAKDLMKESRKENNAFDEVWVVFDKNGYTKHNEAFDEARRNRIEICFSSISFEYWILLHIKCTTKAFKKSDDLISHLYVTT